MTVRRLITVLVVLLLVAPACARSGKDDNGYRLELGGRAEVVSGDEVRAVSAGGHRLAVGDIVRMLAGQAELQLPGDRSILLRAGRAGRSATVVEVAAVPDVVDGDAVVIAGDDVRFTAGDVDVALNDGAARVQRGLSVTVALYAGGATVRSAGRALDGGLAALRQVSVPASGLLPREPAPLLYDEAAPDPWDRRFLGGAIDLGAELDGKARGFTGQLGQRTPVDASLLRQVLPPLAAEDAFDDQLLRDPDTERSAGEALVGASIAVEADGDFVDRWIDVFSFRDDGARWGLVALDQQVKRDALLGTIDEAFGRSPLLFATQGDGGAATAPTTTARPPTAGDGTTTTEPPSTPPTTTAPPTTVPPLTVPPLTIPLLPDDDPPEPDDPGDPREVPDEGAGDPEPTFADVVHDIIDDLLGERPKRGRGR